MMQMVQQKMGNLELTMNALLGVLVDKDVVDQDEVNEKAQEIIQDLQEQQAQVQEGGGLEDALDEE